MNHRTSDSKTNKPPHLTASLATLCGCDTTTTSHPNTIQHSLLTAVRRPHRLVQQIHCLKSVLGIVIALSEEFGSLWDDFSHTHAVRLSFFIRRRPGADVERIPGFDSLPAIPPCRLIDCLLGFLFFAFTTGTLQLYTADNPNRVYVFTSSMIV